MTFEKVNLQKSAPLLSEASPERHSFEEDVTDLSDWLLMLSHLRKSQTVVVGDIKDIEESLLKQKVNCFVTLHILPYCLRISIMSSV